MKPTTAEIIKGLRGAASTCDYEQDSEGHRWCHEAIEHLEAGVYVTHEAVVALALALSASDGQSDVAWAAGVAEAATELLSQVNASLPAPDRSH